MDPLTLQDFRRIFVMASGATSTRLRRAELSGAVLGEETLTEMMVLEMLEMLRRSPTSFDIQTFTHHQEAQNGADLRIWLNLEDAHIGFSIQSKKATFGPGGRTIADSLDHLVGDRKKRQIDILLARSVHDLTNPIHLIYQSPVVGRTLGHGGGCYAMSTYLMDQTMSKMKRPVDKKDLQNYSSLLFPWEVLAAPPVPAPPVPAGPTVPQNLVPRNSATIPDVIDMFGALGVVLGSGSYGSGMGAYEYGLVPIPSAPPGGGGSGPRGGPDDGGNGPDGPEGGPGDAGGGRDGGPAGGRDGGARGPEARAGVAGGDVRDPGTTEDMPKDEAPDGTSPAQNSESATARRGDRSSLLFRTAPRRVLHIGEPVDVDDYGTPLSVIEQGARVQEAIAEAGRSAEQKNSS